MNRTLPAVIGRVLKTRPSALVHYSTDFIFDGRKQSPYLTDDPANPQNVYGRTKFEGEEALLELGLPRCLIVRTAWLFGPHKKNFVSCILGLCRERKELKVVHDQIGSPTYTIDLAQHSLRLVDVGASGIFHVVNSGEASWCELAGEAVKLAQIECVVSPIASADYPHKAERPPYSVLDNGKVARTTGHGIRPWPQALQDYIFRDFAVE
jgi:dTDP-4-dehydrorhamnose reductase